MIIAVLNGKGGVGKSTLALSIAHALAITFDTNNILYIDADPQRTSLKWGQVRQFDAPFKILPMSKTQIQHDLKRTAKKYKFVIIDGPSKQNAITNAALDVCDICLLPCTPSGFDLWETMDTLQLVLEYAIHKPNMKPFLLINRKTPTKMGKLIKEELRELGIPVLSSEIKQRIVLAETTSTGNTIFDLEKDSLAKQEILNLCQEFLTASGFYDKETNYL